MGRAPCCDKNGLKKGPWTPEEDLKLINYIQTHGPGNWRTLPKNAGLQRCGKSCRLRWTNYLRPDIKRGRFSFEEEETIIQLHSVLGNKWSAIAARLPGRTDNEIKNYWNTHIRKRLIRMGIDPVTHAPRLDLLEISSILRSALSLTTTTTSTPPSLLNLQALMINPELLKLITTLLSLKNHHHQNYQDLVSLSPHNNNLIQQIQAAAGDNINNYQQQSSHTHQVDPQIMSMNNIMMSDEFDHQTTNNMSYCTSSSLDNNVDIPSLSSYFWENQNLNGQQQVDLQCSTPNMNSSSTYVNSGTEEERDSHCSDLFKFHIPEITDLDINDFL